MCSPSFACACCVAHPSSVSYFLCLPWCDLYLSADDEKVTCDANSDTYKKAEASGTKHHTCGSAIAYPYFISFYMICSFLVSVFAAAFLNRLRFFLRITDDVLCEQTAEEKARGDPPTVCGSSFAYAYFISFYIICSFMVRRGPAECGEPCLPASPQRSNVCPRTPSQADAVRTISMETWLM